MPELKFARPPRPAGEATVDPSTGVVVFPHPTKEELIQRAEAFLEGGCCVIFKGVHYQDVVAALRTAGLSDLLKAMGIKD